MSYSTSFTTLTNSALRSIFFSFQPSEETEPYSELRNAERLKLHFYTSKQKGSVFLAFTEKIYIKREYNCHRENINALFRSLRNETFGNPVSCRYGTNGECSIVLILHLW